MYTDTDSLFYEINTKDYYKDIIPDVDQWFDTSCYSIDHPSRIPIKNKGELEKMKDECGGDLVLKANFIRPKVYDIMTKKKETKKSKVVNLKMSIKN